MVNRYEAVPAANNPNWPADCVRQLEKTSTITTSLGCIEYSPVIVSGDGLEDVYDSRFPSRSGTTTLYFPALQRITPKHVARIDTLPHGQASSPEPLPGELRMRLLGLSVGEAASQRYDRRAQSKHVTPIDELAQKAERMRLKFAEELYSIWNVPLAAVNIRGLVRHPLAKRVFETAILYTPVAVAPEEGLQWLQDALK